MEINNKIEKTLNELYKFSEEILFLGESISDTRIEDLEHKIGYKLPFDFKHIMKKHNGILLAGTEIYGLSTKLKDNSIEKIYYFEHFEVDNPMPTFFFPFSPDGRGNHYCLNLSKMQDGFCPVVFWQWDVEYQAIEDVEECNSDFVDWIEEVMIEWTLESFNYDGTEK